jgi:hypothetical protein
LSLAHCCKYILLIKIDRSYAMLWIIVIPLFC